MFRNTYSLQFTIPKQYQPEMKMDTMDALQPTLAQLNSPGSNENSNSLSAMKVRE